MLRLRQEQPLSHQYHLVVHREARLGMQVRCLQSAFMCSSCFYMTMLLIAFCTADANILTVEKLFDLFGRKMCAQWKEFAVFVSVDLNTRRLISQKCQNIGEDCFKELINRWLRSGDGTGDLPRTWETVFKALRLTGFPLLVEDVREALSKECSGGEKRLRAVHVVPLTLVSDVHFQV